MAQTDDKRRLVLPGAISVAAGSALAVHLVFPGVKFDGATFGLLAIAMLPWLAPLVKSNLQNGLDDFAMKDWPTGSGHQSVESGLAMYLPCSFHGNPYFGTKINSIDGQPGPFWDLTNARKFGAFPHTPDEDYAEGDAWGALLWGVRNLGSPPIVDRVAVDAWIEANTYRADSGLGPDFRPIFARKLANRVGAEAGSASATQVLALVRKRGLRPAKAD